MSDPRDHDTLRKLAQEATPGPWTVHKARTLLHIASALRWVTSISISPPRVPERDIRDEAVRSARADAAFIAAANPQVVLGLLDEIARLQAGGCARDQRTTQFCAEVVERDRVIRELRGEVERLTGELAEYRGAPLLAAEINALPIRVRIYIRDIETRCDPTGDIQTIASLTEQRDGLVLRLRELEDMLVAAGIYHPDPIINAEVEAEAAEHAAFDLAAGVVPGWHRFVDCDAEHPCPRCGYRGVPGTTHSTECLYPTLPTDRSPN